jgi:hypothetical protein
MNFNKSFMDRFFRSVDNVVWDMMSGKVGFKTSSGICAIDLGAVSEDKTEAPDAQVSVNPFEDFGMAVPAFAQSVPVDSIALGDMIFSSATNKVLGWVVKVQGKSFKLMKQEGTRSDWVPPKVQMLGFDSGVMVLRSLMNMLPGGASGLGQMQNMLMPMMAMGMMGDGDSGGGMDMKAMMPMMLMSQMGMGGAEPAPAGSNPMAGMMPMMMMMQMMKGGSGPGNLRTGNSKSFFDK